MSTSPSFTSAPVLAIASVSAANTNRDGTGTIVDLTPLTPIPLLAPAAGRLINKLKIKATGQVAACVAKLYIWDGAAYRLYTEVLISATSPGTTLAALERDIPIDLVLQQNEKLGADITVATVSGTVLFIASGGELT